MVCSDKGGIYILQACLLGWCTIFWGVDMIMYTELALNALKYYQMKRNFRGDRMKGRHDDTRDRVEWKGARMRRERMWERVVCEWHSEHEAWVWEALTEVNGVHLKRLVSALLMMTKWPMSCCYSNLGLGKGGWTFLCFWCSPLVVWSAEREREKKMFLKTTTFR